MPFGPSSRINLATFRASSLLIPCVIVAVIFHSLPESRGSPASSDLRSILRRTNMVWNTSRIAFTRSSPLASISMASPLALILSLIHI